MLLFDLHTHTYFSHGKGSPEDNIKKALDLGLKAIAITDHAPGHVAYGVRNTEKYFSQLRALKEKYNGRITVKSGLEFNILGLGGQTDLLAEYVPELDISLAGYHKLTLARDARSFNYFAFTGKKDILKNTRAYIKIVESGSFDIIAHPGYVLKLEIKAFAKACRQCGVLIEINEKHNDLTAEELLTAAEQGAEFILSSDAHASEAVGKVGRAYAAAESAGILSAVVNTSAYKGAYMR